eukprot:scaffold54059_cov19-Tisochrysis_lutea.AAC.1
MGTPPGPRPRPSPEQQPLPCCSLSAAFPFIAGKAHASRGSRGGEIVAACCAVDRGAAGFPLQQNSQTDLLNCEMYGTRMYNLTCHSSGKGQGYGCGSELVLS